MNVIMRQIVLKIQTKIFVTNEQIATFWDIYIYIYICIWREIQISLFYWKFRDQPAIPRERET